MPELRAYFDNNQGATPGWNRMRLSGGTSGNGLSIAEGAVVDPDGDIIADCSIDLSGIIAAAIFNSSATTAVPSGDAAWVSPVNIVAVDGLQLSVVDSWIPVRVNVPDGSPNHVIEGFGTSAAGANNRWVQVRVNGGTPQLLNVSNAQGTNIVRFTNIEPLTDGGGEYYLIEIARHSSSSGGNSFLNALRVFPYLVSPVMTVTTDGGSVVEGEAFEVLCENFGGVPDGDTFAFNTWSDEVIVATLPVTVSVTDNLDDTYTLAGTYPELPPTSTPISYARFGDVDALVTHTMTIDTVGG